MSTLVAIPAPDPDDGIARELAELERQFQPPAPVEAADAVPAGLGDTRKVRRLRRKVAEAHVLAGLHDDDTPLLLDTARVRRRRRAAHQAARLHELSQDPAALAYRDQKVRRTVSVMVMAAAGIALAVSSIGVQTSVVAALNLAKEGAAWWAAYLVEPALSLPLLATVAVQAYAAMRGQVIDRRSEQGRKMFRTEALLLGLTLVLNCWPALAGGFDLLSLIVHSLGPIAAVTAIWVLPALWSALAALPMPPAVPTAGATAAKYSANAHPAGGVETRAVDVHRERARALIAAGKLPAQPSASALRTALHCGTDIATVLRDELAGGAR
ncbi:hypothetical protein ACIBKY_39135 [Nonomuraea sp. NPDC050394]|uniref:hypothetical protein n=1 Tax=Nonomuraea sp. NPDC050394 TaxID=3364363 RepID=UPI0037A9C325